MDSADKVQPPEPATPVRRLTRRALLGLGAAGGIAALTKVSGADNAVQNVAQMLQNLEPLEEVAFLAGVKDEIPPILQGKEIPERNEDYRKPQAIILEGFDTYNRWREQNPQLPSLNWKKPDNYLDYPAVVKGAAKETALQLEKEEIQYASIPSILSQTVNSNGIPYSNFATFSGNTITSPDELIELDPGSGIARKIVNKFKTIKNNQDYDLHSEIKKHKLTDQDKALLGKEIRRSIDTAVDYIRKQGNEEPVSTSLLFAYFLHENDGNISQSFWDTTVMLKLLIRNKMDTLEFQPTREAADLVNSLFLDEFSPGVSFNWVNENVPSSEERLNNRKEEEFKNYQPINRAGGLYHAWNEISWVTCMSPSLVMNLTRAYFAPMSKDLDYRQQHGTEKIRADIRVAAAADDIAKLIAPYEQKGF